MTDSIAIATSAPKAASGTAAPLADAPAGGPQRQQRQRVKAQLDLFHAKPSKEGATLGESRGTIKFQFNPKEVSIAKSAKWARQASRNSKKAGPVEFNGSDPCKLTVEMFLDCSDTHDGSVVAGVEQLLGCCVPTEKSLGEKKAMPPLVVFRWGQIISFPGFITSVNAKYSLFDADGTPIRATCTVTMEEMPGSDWGEMPKQNPTSGGVVVHEMRTIGDGDSLAAIAYREYDDAAMWRPLAQYNDIDDPLRLRIGTRILVPPAEELAVAGE